MNFEPCGARNCIWGQPDTAVIATSQCKCLTYSDVREIQSKDLTKLQFLIRQLTQRLNMSVIEARAVRAKLLEANKGLNNFAQLQQQRDVARKMVDDSRVRFVRAVCPICGHHKQPPGGTSCEQCFSNFFAPWNYPEVLPDLCACERCEARKSGVLSHT